MGQYQQWLHHRTVDQQLQAQQKQLEKELADLHERADLLKDSASPMDNVIIQALARLHREISQTDSLSARPIGGVAATMAGAGPVDQQSARTNQLVQRWMERWGRHTEPVEVHTDAERVFSQLHPEDVEQFYQSYQYWQLQQCIAQLQAQISTVQQEASENSERMEQTAPGAIALATLVRLQSSGVNDIGLLDRMLERGEIWLDSAMQLLEHCEDLKVIDGDYTRWCELALEGAYDWIPSMIGADSLPSPQRASLSTSSSEQATEEMVLQKLMSDDGLEQFPGSEDSPPALAAIPAEETTDVEEIELPTTEESALGEEATLTEERAMPSIEEFVLTEELDEQKMSGERVAVQISSSVGEVATQEQEVGVPETPRPGLLEAEAEGPATEEELITVAQVTAGDADEGIHAVEEIMYFTDENCWQWEESEEEPATSQAHLPILPEHRTEQNIQDVQSIKQGFFHRLFKKK
jgi:hypothetical protein